ncbi:PIG-L family deacetylase [Candidatus Woesearchaeota archaeon]|nr:PIG-L family deacetylase [Candidatus Woesearchaeota archaeon]
MNWYSLLPHYTFNNGTVVFLEREVVPISEEQKRVVAGLKSQQVDDRDPAVSTLVNAGIIARVISIAAQKKCPSKIVVSPHSDDAALSMGGHLILNGSDYNIITVFNTCPFSDNFRAYEMSPAEITECNNKEDVFYARMIGADIVFLNQREALERAYDSPFEKKIKRGDAEMIAEVRSQLTALTERANVDSLYFPLSLGNHIDHVILHLMGRSFTEKGCRIRFYEDQPYTEEMSEAELKEQMAEKTKGLRIAQEVDITDVLEEKMRLAAIYKTQYDRSYLEKLGTYARKIGAGGRAIERTWEVVA